MNGRHHLLQTWWLTGREPAYRMMKIWGHWKGKKHPVLGRSSHCWMRVIESAATMKTLKRRRTRMMWWQCTWLCPCFECYLSMKDWHWRRINRMAWVLIVSKMFALQAADVKNSAFNIFQSGKQKHSTIPGTIFHGRHKCKSWTSCSTQTKSWKILRVKLLQLWEVPWTDWFF